MVSGIPDTHPPYRVPLAELTFHLFLFKIRPSVYMTIPNPSRGMRQLGLPRQICSHWQAGELSFIQRHTSWGEAREAAALSYGDCDFSGKISIRAMTLERKHNKIMLLV